MEPSTIYFTIESDSSYIDLPVSKVKRCVMARTVNNSPIIGFCRSRPFISIMDIKLRVTLIYFGHKIIEKTFGTFDSVLANDKIRPK